MIDIRQISVADAPLFREALDAVCRERKYLAAMEAPSLDRATTFVEANVKAGFPQFVAEADGKIVGWCDAIPGDMDSGTEHIGRLGMGVLKDYRGRGIGRRLLEATIERARSMGLEKIELSVYSSNTAAIDLYRKFGFQDEGLKRRGRWVDGLYDDVLLMALFLGEQNQRVG
jgi:ribosomal protein S18 acetylase RimI-like enzyme